MLGSKLRSELSSSSTQSPTSPPRNRRGDLVIPPTPSSPAPQVRRTLSAPFQLDASTLRRAVEVLVEVQPAGKSTFSVRAESPSQKARIIPQISQLVVGEAGLGGYTEGRNSRTRSPSGKHIAVVSHLLGSGASLRPEVYQQFQGCRRHVSARSSSAQESLGCAGIVNQPRDISTERRRRSSSGSHTGMRTISVDTPFRGVGIFGPDPAEEATKERPIPPPMIKKPWKRGVRRVPEPSSTRRDNESRYSHVTASGAFQHGKRQVSPKHFEPKPASIRFNIAPCDNMHSFSVESPHRARPTSIRCGSPTARPRTFNIINNIAISTP